MPHERWSDELGGLRAKVAATGADRPDALEPGLIPPRHLVDQQPRVLSGSKRRSEAGAARCSACLEVDVGCVLAVADRSVVREGHMRDVQDILQQRGIVVGDIASDLGGSERGAAIS